MTNPTIFNTILIWPFINLLILFYKFFETAKVPGAFGWAIIALTITVRTILSPLTKKQMDSARKMQAIKPHLDALNKKHKGDRQTLQKEQMKLYQEHGINPAAGCLPLLVSFPILIALYRVFIDVLASGTVSEIVQQINQVVYFPFLHIQDLDLWFFGINLASKPSQWQEIGWWLLAIPVATGILQYFQMKSTPGMAPVPTTPDKKTKKDAKKEDKPEDMARSIQRQMTFLFPIMIGFAAYSFPAGLSLYWNTFSAMTIWTQRKHNKTTT